MVFCFQGVFKEISGIEWVNRSSHSEVKAPSKTFPNVTGKHIDQRISFNIQSQFLSLNMPFSFTVFSCKLYDIRCIVRHPVLRMSSVNPFVLSAPFLYLLKTPENLKIFWCFQGVEKKCIGNEWVKCRTSH